MFFDIDVYILLGNIWTHLVPLMIVSYCIVILLTSDYSHGTLHQSSPSSYSLLFSILHFSSSSLCYRLY